MNEYSRILKSKGISPSIQRVKIFEFLDKNRFHPTVDDIYNGLIEDIPTLSKMTIYNTMKLFLKNDLIKSVPSKDNTSHYDIDVTSHSHFKCKICNEVFDTNVVFNIDYSKIEESGLNVTDINILFEGVCNKCKLKEKD